MKRLSTIILALPAISVSRAHAQVLAGPLTNAANGHAYYLLAITNWPAAEAQEVALGGHLEWPANACSFQLEGATNLVSPDWATNFSGLPVIITNGMNTVTMGNGGENWFYRWAKP